MAGFSPLELFGLFVLALMFVPFARFLGVAFIGALVGLFVMIGLAAEHLVTRLYRRGGRK